MQRTRMSPPWQFALLLALAVSGCASPYARDRLAGAGAVLGGVTGAVVGHQLGHTAGGAIVGAAAGGLAGAVAGDAIDESEARNRAEIHARTGAMPAPGALQVEDILAMHQAGVPETVIASHIGNRGMARPLQTGDIIRLQQCGVSPMVMEAAQRTPVPAVAVAPVAYAPPPTAVIVEEHWGPPPCYYYHRPYYRPRPAVGVGFSYHKR